MKKLTQILPSSEVESDTLEFARANHVFEILGNCNGNQKEAADILDILPNTIGEMIKRWGIKCDKKKGLLYWPVAAMLKIA